KLPTRVLSVCDRNSSLNPEKPEQHRPSTRTSAFNELLASKAKAIIGSRADKVTGISETCFRAKPNLAWSQFGINQK
ncbi:MAG: hypothetical protein AAFO63_07335, partial [Pseudomonadota bacterium]